MKKIQSNPKSIKRTSKELILLKLDMIKYKGGCCQKCGYNRHYSALTFHHIDPSQKRYEWKQMKHMHRKLIRKELDKCVLLCNNCHCEEHAKDLLKNNQTGKIPSGFTT
jgi:predicted nucleic-acid-binding Zn-ribbon protein